MKPILAKYSQCTGCGACAATCNVGAITLDYDRNGHLTPVIDTQKCVGCNRCTKACPVLNENRVKMNDPREITTYTAWSTDNDLCLQATSGGVFSQLANNILQRPQASVYGAFLTDHNTCHHVEINTKEKLKDIIGTKYLQSDASRVFPSIKKHLKNNEPCLFCGTPCQVAGLYSYLDNINTDQLFTIELICHGVPSKMATDITCEAHNATHLVSYRDKKDGHKKGFSYTYKTGEQEVLVRSGAYNNVFGKMFGNTDRPSCYRCKYAQIARSADLTIGDQWGLLHKYPERKALGSCLVMCNSDKGKRLLLEAENIETDLNDNITLNAPTLFMPMKMGATNKTSLLWLLKYLPLNTRINILSSNWRKAPWLLPYVALKRLNAYIYRREFKRKLAQVRRQLGWTK